MPLYEVRRRTVVTFSVVEADSELEARIKARDVWQQDAAIASLAADVTRKPSHEPYDQERDNLIDFPPPDDSRDSGRPWAPTDADVAAYHAEMQRLRGELGGE